jgi:Linalool dehydratase/isomerase
VTRKTVTERLEESISPLLRRLADFYPQEGCAWARFYQPRRERRNFASRYHLVYPALGYYLLLRRRPELAPTIRPILDVMYRGLLQPRCWEYWHRELGETSWPLQERNLTFAGRLATFVGLYISSFGQPPTPKIVIGDRAITYSELSHSLAAQAAQHPSGGVSCYHHQSMVMCNAHLLINNVLHDRLFGTALAATNAGWLRTVEDGLVCNVESGPLFYHGTKPLSAEPQETTQCLGADIWALFLMSAVIPNQVRLWFSRWQPNIRTANGHSWVDASSEETEAEITSTPLATAWTAALARELGLNELGDRLHASLAAGLSDGFALDPLVSGLCLLGAVLQPGDFRRLVAGAAA